MTNTTENLLLSPQSTPALLGALREHVASLHGSERRHGFDLHAMLVGLAGAAGPAVEAAYAQLEGAVPNAGELKAYANSAPYSSVLALITRALAA